MVLEQIWNDAKTEIGNKFGFVNYDFDDLFSQSSPIEDVEGDYTIPGLGSFSLTFMDSSVIIQAVNFFRPYIRGLIVLLIVLFNIRQASSFFGYSSGEIKNFHGGDNA